MNKPTILIIEDEPLHLNVMKTKLELEGYAVIAEADGKVGYGLIKSEKPDLVLLDIMLPSMDGFEILEQLQKDGVKVPIIVVSNSGQPVEIDKALKMGVKDYLIKAEFNPADVLEKVEKVLGKPPFANGAINAPNSAVGDSSAAASAQDPAKISANGQKILVVEDDKFLRDLIVQKLKRENFITCEAIDGEEGIKFAKEKHPDLVLLDLILPSIDGFGVLGALKNSIDTSSIPVIVLSNLGQKEDMDRAMSGGAEAFMVKAHFTPGEIIEKIKEVLKKKI